MFSGCGNGIVTAHAVIAFAIQNGVSVLIPEGLLQPGKKGTIYNNVTLGQGIIIHGVKGPFHHLIGGIGAVIETGPAGQMIFGIFILYQRAVQFSVTVPGATLRGIYGIFTA